MYGSKFKSKIKTYYELTKPRIWYLLVFTAFGSFIIASNIYDIEIKQETLVLMLIGVAAGSAAANTLTNYHDRDIDEIMDRTKNRPIPSKRITPKNAKNFGLILVGISMICSFGIIYTTSFVNGVLVIIFMSIGLFDNIIVYSYILKRRSRSNIILGGFSGAAPSMIGYAAVTTSGLFDLGLIIGGLVFVWIPMHIWSLSLHFKKDYNKVNIPMLTAVVPENIAVRIITITTLMMVVFSILPVLIKNDGGQMIIGFIYLYTAIISGAVITVVSAWSLFKPFEKSAWLLFKFSNPYLAILFIALMIDSSVS